MKDKIEQLYAEFEGAISKVSGSDDIEAIRIDYLGKKGHIAELMKGLRDATDKRAAGQLINELKNKIESGINLAQQTVKNAEIEAKIRNAKKYNPSMRAKRELGSYHPITLATREVEEIFVSMGFTIEDYAEIVDDYECFESLNIPKHHPARDMQDTYYLENGQLLKTQTSAVRQSRCVSLPECADLCLLPTVRR